MMIAESITRTTTGEISNPLTPNPLLSINSLMPRSRRSQNIADELNQLIRSGQLKPGDKLPTETILCQKFGVSRTTLREALHMLRSTGMLDVTPGRGSFVRSPNLEMLAPALILAARNRMKMPAAELSSMRLLLQRDALQKIGPVHTRLKDQIKQLFQYILVRSATPAENAAQDAAWHLALTRLADHPLEGFILEMLLNMQTETRETEYRNPDTILRTIHLQMRLNTALMDGDFALAERVLSQCLGIFTPEKSNIRQAV
jgi:GntR family transcriptional repressor for pyruvate dehydrogenase complex